VGANDSYAGEEREEQKSLRGRLSGQAEDAIGRLADDLLENPVINSALQRAFGAREFMAQAQEQAMDALNIPSATNLDKLARRMRSMSQRLEEIEDGLERLDRRVEAIADETRKVERGEERLDRIETQLDELSRDVAALRRELAPGDVIPATQTRAIVPEG
jgi:predicted RNase H-like nuclease (RuvC/YqgF family)